MGRKKTLGDDSVAVTIRIKKEQKESIQFLIGKEKYKDLSSFVRKAIDSKLARSLKRYDREMSG